MKKVLIALILLVMAGIVAASFAVRRAPEWLRSALGGVLGKTVAIRAIDFQFPTTFVLTGVTVSEKDGPFAGEPEFSAETVRLSALPTGLRRGRPALDEIAVKDATIVVRKFGGKLYHAFSRPAAAAEPPSASSPPAAPARRLSVALLRLENSRFQFTDYDAAEQGFVFDCEAVEARIAGFQVPPSDQKTSYSVQGRLLQGRGEKPAAFRVSGATVFSTLDTQARGELQNLHLTYFASHVSQVTSAVLEEGFLDMRMQAEIRSGDLSADAELAFTSLYFRSLEGDNQLFGLSAAEILNFLKDSSGRLRIPVSVRWNFRTREARLRDVVRQSIEASLKRTVFGNVGALLEAAIVRIGQKGLDAPEKTADTLLKKIKDFLKY